ncbi:hypothetical protein FEM03_06270 [Phragmitibacter flavus]|uniref:GNAT family N-acetyltransferase n=1 Tax=Phragmitibacter flavus TaxID=2576071 RepID=A0A5R8KHM1_9BACT|nr:hypothetical protein [Phragmitibacter flavus]TLD71741.1 hypothetical protein FEM03_06270 [Phragmitibacter flavus]
MSTVQHTHPSIAGLPDSLVVQDIIRASGLKLVILPPSVQALKKNAGVWVHESSLMEIRRFRGSMCLSNGLVPPEAVDATGCHFLACDSVNHHLMMVQSNGRLAACLRVRMHPVGTTASGLRMFESIRRFPPSSHGSSVINDLILQARQQQLGVAELGGWVMSPERRDCKGAALLPIIAWALVQQLGGALMLEHADASGETPAILRGLGQPLSYLGQRIAPVPNTHYGRPMEVLGAFSNQPPDPLQRILDSLTELISSAT